MKTSIVAITGQKGSGKDTLAQFFNDEGFIQISFAGPIKQICAIAFLLTEEEMEDRELKEKKLDRWPYESPRHLMQIVGTEMFRSFYPDIWVELARQKMKNYPAAVISDLRFLNEEEMIRSENGAVIRINRPKTDEGDVSDLS